MFYFTPNTLLNIIVLRDQNYKIRTPVLVDGGFIRARVPSYLGRYYLKGDLEKTCSGLNLFNELYVEPLKLVEYCAKRIVSIKYREEISTYLSYNLRQKVH